ncbi:hypothetical protein HML84_18675 [Alcanivorax sp. IO_7]|nr:hypothetical protein HML84_18675 [Alcanivorax sp. IO_7]
MNGGVSPLLLAVVYVVCTLGTNLTGLVPGYGARALVAQWIGLACLIPIWWTLLQCQKGSTPPWATAPAGPITA